MRISTQLLLIAPLLASCVATQESVQAYAPELLELFNQANLDEARLREDLPGLESAVSDAVASPDLSDDLSAAEALAAANAELARVEGTLANLDEAVSRRQAAPLGGLLPYGLGALAVEAIAALGSKRKRKLYVSALRSMSRGQLLVVASDILKAYGVQHSRPEPASLGDFRFPAPATGNYSGGVVVTFSGGEQPPPAPAPIS